MDVLFLVLFAATLVILYIAVRREWAPTVTLGGVGAILSVLFVTLYALLGEQTSTGQALFAGFVVGLGFAAAVVATASFFRANQPPADVNIVTQTPQEELDHERRNYRHPPSQ